ncbi:hypothetical protein K432DRAFT_392387 [Lepidopterella palustris CBS 459.81]|uniref:Uncharacterized protein n=1 Tax=Lepidopterella palustris CBS 459.81 TaxID=1314670 RepID=A0A8E2ECA3_9PEZI|nr:hypothetical protein K432DRAFT_392387 [Lepidopterella palustris CBS 459.81]
MTVTTDTSIESTIGSTNISNGGTQLVCGLRICLAASTDGNMSPTFFYSDCTLISKISICDPSITVLNSYVALANTTFSVTIPPSVGPSGTNYIIKLQLIQTDGQYYGGDFSSNEFTLTGATGNWSQFQLLGYTLWTADGNPTHRIFIHKNCCDVAYALYHNLTNAYRIDNVPTIALV